jgi:hypothetical protein
MVFPHEFRLVAAGKRIDVRRADEDSEFSCSLVDLVAQPLKNLGENSVVPPGLKFPCSLLPSAEALG